MELKSIAKLFARAGAKCRKLRGRNAYECWKDNVRAVITEDKIEISSAGEFRVEYLFVGTSDGWREEHVMRRLEEITGADSAYIVVPDCRRADLTLEFSLDKAARAAEVMKKMADHDIRVVITNMHGELRLYKDGEQVGTEEWLSGFRMTV